MTMEKPNGRARWFAGAVALCLLAGAANAQTTTSSSNTGPSVESLQKKPTPKLGGKPDLSGNWYSGSGSIPPLEFETVRGADGSIQMKMAATKENGATFGAQFNPAATVQPQFKPEFQAKVADNFKHLSTTDKAYSCGQPGLPRIGAPQKITQTPKELIFLYADIAGMAWRVIPIAKSAAAFAVPSENEPSYYGEGVAHWEGDTLVVQTKNFTEDTWFGEFGYFHTLQMSVTERFKRVGDTIVYDITVTDPGVLTAPWPKPRQILTKQDFEIMEPSPCHIEQSLEGPPTEGGYHAQRF